METATVIINLVVSILNFAVALWACLTLPQKDNNGGSSARTTVKRKNVTACEAKLSITAFIHAENVAKKSKRAGTKTKKKGSKKHRKRSKASKKRRSR